ncbi:hypothetical protein ACFL0D_00495 [Thermoproteota archaeon]
MQIGFSVKCLRAPDEILLNDSARWGKDQHRDRNVLRNIATGNETSDEIGPVSMLEEKGMVKEGQLTMAGLLVYHRLQ